MIFVDTNYFLRFLLKDNEPQYEASKKLFIEAAQQKVKLTTSLVVFFEVVWVLRSSYGKNKQPLVEVLSDMLKLNFEFTERHLVRESIRIFQETNLSMEDCYNLVFAKEEHIKDFKTFDKKLLKRFNQLT